MTGTIREFRQGDEIGIHKAHTKSVREICSKDYSPEEIEAWIGSRQPQDYVEAIEKYGEHYWILDCDGIIAGFSSWCDDRIVGFYMHPDYVGRGLARQLFEKTEYDFLERSGLKTCSITSTITARAFYERMGFQAVKPYRHVLKSGSEIDVWEMTKHYG